MDLLEAVAIKERGCIAVLLEELSLRQGQGIHPLNSAKDTVFDGDFLSP